MPWRIVGLQLLLSSTRVAPKDDKEGARSLSRHTQNCRHDLRLLMKRTRLRINRIMAFTLHIQ